MSKSVRVFTRHGSDVNDLVAPVPPTETSPATQDILMEELQALQACSSLPARPASMIDACLGGGG
jgi:hypothetical protein